MTLELIRRHGRIPTYKHKVTLFYGEKCPHCKAVMEVLKPFMSQHPEIMFSFIDAETDTGRALLYSLGFEEVPITLVDDLFIIRGDVNYLERLTYTLKLSEVTPKKPRRVTLRESD